MTQSPHVLVTGGAGYIGSHVVRALLEHGWAPVVLDDLSTGHRQSVPDTVDFVRGSIGDRQALDRLFTTKQIRSVVHLAAATYVEESVRAPERYYYTNVAEALGLLESMAAHGVDRIVFSSSCTVYGIPAEVPVTEASALRPINPYGCTKAIFEQMLRDFHVAHGLQWVALRYFNAGGADAEGDIGEDHRPEPHLVPRILQSVLHRCVAGVSAPAEPLTVYGSDYPTRDGTCVRDYVHVVDLADAHVRALEYLDAGEQPIAINLANEEGLSVLEVVHACQEVTGYEIPYVFSGRRHGDAPELIGDARLAGKVLGWKARCSELRHIIETAWRWHSTHPHGYRNQGEP